VAGIKGRVRVAVDAMGGDNAPEAAVAGALLATSSDDDLQVILVGRESVVAEQVDRLGGPRQRGIEVLHAGEAVGMDEAPAAAVRAKPQNSMSVGMRLIKSGDADAFVTAGNTGAALVAGLVGLGRIPGVRRPALTVVFPGVSRPCLVLDIGANADCKPIDLVQFGLMGCVYAEKVLGVPNPTVGLISNGEEEGKGNQLTREAFALLQESGLSFVGNIESKDLGYAACTVAVTDGFTGNVLIKGAEGVAKLMTDLIRKEAGSSLPGRIGGLLLRPSFRRVSKRLDYAEVGGAPLLGLDGVVLVGHGRSSARAVASMVRAGAEAARQGIVDAIKAGLQEGGPVGDSQA